MKILLEWYDDNGRHWDKFDTLDECESFIKECKLTMVNIWEQIV